MTKGDGKILLLSFLIPAFMMFVVFASVGVFPFGTKTLVDRDAANQYISFYAFLIDLFSGKGDFFYSFKKVLGGGISGLYAYYLASPFNLLFVPFGRENIPQIADLIIFLKICCCGLSFAVYIRETGKLSLYSLAFSTAYALCGYNIAFCWCSMWIDAVILLPLIALGIKRICSGGEPYLYVFSLTVSIISCFYTGWMLCLASVLLFAMELLQSGVPLKKRKRDFCCFAASSLCAGGISAVLLLPALNDLSGGEDSVIDIVKNYTYPMALRILSFLLPGKSADEYDSAVKYVLFAMILLCLIMTVLVFFAFFSSRCSTNVRRTVSAVALVLFVLFYYAVEIYAQKYVARFNRNILAKSALGIIPEWDMIDGSPQLYTGVLPVMLTGMFLSDKSIDRKRRTVLSFVLLLLIASFALFLPNLVWHGFELNGGFNFRYSFIFCFLVCATAEKMWERIDSARERSLLFPFVYLLAVIIITIIEAPDFLDLRQCLAAFLLILLIAFGFFCWFKTNRKTCLYCLIAVHFLSLWIYLGVSIDNIDEYALRTDEYKTKISNSYTDSIDWINEHDSGFYRIRKDKTLLNLNDPMFYGYNGLSHFSSGESYQTTHFLNTIGIDAYEGFWANGEKASSRAVDALLGVRYYIGENSEFPDYPALADGVFINPYALPIAFLAEPVVDCPAEDNSVGENINLVYSELCNSDICIFEPTELNFNSLQKVYSANVESAEPLYAEVGFTGYSTAKVFLNGEEINSFTYTKKRMLHNLGSFAAGDEVWLQFCDGEGHPVKAGETVSAFYENTDALEYAVSYLNDCLCTVEKINESKLSCKTEYCGNAVLFTTIPYSKNWRVRIDGAQSDSIAAFGTFLAVDVPAGEHCVELRYVPAGFAEGIVISVLSLCCVGIYSIRRRHKKID